MKTLELTDEEFEYLGQMFNAGVSEYCIDDSDWDMIGKINDKLDWGKQPPPTEEELKKQEELLKRPEEFNNSEYGQFLRKEAENLNKQLMGNEWFKTEIPLRIRFPNDYQVKYDESK